MELNRRVFPVILFLALGLTLSRILLAIFGRFFYYVPDSELYTLLNFLMIASWAFLISSILVATSSRFWGERS